MRSSAVTAVLIAVALPATLGASPEPTPTDGLPEGTTPLFRVEDPRIEESSGLATSPRHDGIYWTHNDSGDYGPQIYAVNGEGETVATITLAGSGVEARDWEAIAAGVDDHGEPALFVGDIGDNRGGEWPNVRVYRIPEPERLTDRTVEATTFTYTYAKGARNAEAMMIDPRDNRLHVVSKEAGGGVYAAPKDPDPDSTNTLERVGSAPLYATDAAFSPDGSHYAIRTYWGATIYDATKGVPGRSRGRVRLPKMDQGESLTYNAKGTALVAGTEGERSPVWSVPLPEGASGRPSPSAREGTHSPGTTSASGGASPLIWTGAALAAVVIVGIAVLVRKT